MVERNELPENLRSYTKYTLEIRSQEGELWFLRAFPTGKVRSALGEIMSVRSFWSRGWTLVVRPYNQETDRERIGDLKFLGDRTVLL